VPYKPKRLSFRWLAFLFAGSAIVLLAYAYVTLLGSAIVIDETGGVESAVVTNDEREQPLRELWSGYFFAFPELEGELEVRCRNGETKRAGYVTAGLRTKIRVVGDPPCAHIVDVF
jgi:hypothetical protein